MPHDKNKNMNEDGTIAFLGQPVSGIERFLYICRDNILIRRAVRSNFLCLARATGS